MSDEKFEKENSNRSVENNLAKIKIHRSLLLQNAPLCLFCLTTTRGTQVVVN